jgi:hypothetical protein
VNNRYLLRGTFVLRPKYERNSFLTGEVRTLHACCDIATTDERRWLLPNALSAADT